jgi:hypothetical protein
LDKNKNINEDGDGEDIETALLFIPALFGRAKVLDIFRIL